MRYENRQPREGINITAVSPLRQMVRLLLAAIVLVVLIVSVLQFSASRVARLVPFGFERMVVEQLTLPFGSPGVSEDMDDYLGTLAARLSEGMDMPAEQRVDVHYDSAPTFNAFATLGGQIVLYRGLLEAMPNENALAMVLAHELAHIQHRDPVAGLGGYLAGTLVILALTGEAGGNAAGSLLQSTGLVTGIQFTRRMEVRADATALSAVASLYGHVAGADTLFRLIGERRGRTGGPRALERFLATHPPDDDRVAEILSQARREGWPRTGEMTPLPTHYRQWLKQGPDANDP